MALILQPTVFLYFPNVAAQPMAKVPSFLDSALNEFNVKPFSGADDVCFYGKSPFVNGDRTERAEVVSAVPVEDDRMSMKSILSGAGSFEMRVNLRAYHSDPLQIAVSFQKLSHINKGRGIESVSDDGMIIACRQIVSNTGSALLTSKSLEHLVEKHGAVVVVSSDADDGNYASYVRTVAIKNAPDDTKATSVKDALKPVFSSVMECAGAVRRKAGCIEALCESLLN